MKDRQIDAHHQQLREKHQQLQQNDQQIREKDQKDQQIQEKGTRIETVERENFMLKFSCLQLVYRTAAISAMWKQWGVLSKDFFYTLMLTYDIVLLSTSGDGLRRHLSSFEPLCKELEMEVNKDKTKICVIGRNANIEPLWWNGSTL